MSCCQSQNAQADLSGTVSVIGQIDHGLGLIVILQPSAGPRLPFRPLR